MVREMKIQNIPKQERPREKLYALGAGFLTDSELLAILLGSGTVGSSAVEVGCSLLRELGGLNGVLDASLETLLKRKGIGKSKAATILALSELCKRGYVKGNASLKERIHRFAKAMPPVEEAIILGLDGHGKVVGERLIARGSEESLHLSMSHLFKSVVGLSVSRFALVHLHPSGFAMPSEEDITFTDALAVSTQSIGLKMVDHLIVGPEAIYSFRENGLLS